MPEETVKRTIEDAFDRIVELSNEFNACIETYTPLELLQLAADTVWQIPPNLFNPLAAKDMLMLLLASARQVAEDCGLEELALFEFVVPPPSAPPPTPQNVMKELLTQISDAINAAEDHLNHQNFVIAAGTVNATLKVALGLAEADTAISLNITPNPYGPNLDSSE